MGDDRDNAATDFDIQDSHQNSLESFWTAFKNEFKLRRLGFNFNRTDVFTASQWRFPRFVFVVYRLAAAAYAISITLMTIIQFDPDRVPYPWPVFLTSWSYLVLACHLLCSAVVAVIGVIDRSSVLPSEPIFQRALPFYLRLTWLIFVVASSLALLVTISYFTTIFPRMGITRLSAGDVHLHVMNSVLIVLDLAISAIPVRFLHVVYLVAFGAVYVAFSAIFWAFDHSRVVYPGVLDWNRPLPTMIIILLFLVLGSPIIQCLLFAAYRLRLCVYRRIYMTNV